MHDETTDSLQQYASDDPPQRSRALLAWAAAGITLAGPMLYMGLMMPF